MICSESRPLIAHLPLELLDDAEAAPLESHLAECGACRAAADDLEASYAEVGAALPGEDDPVPAGLWERIAKEVEAEPAAKSATPARELPIMLSCTFCHDALVRLDASYCAGCLAPHHTDCFAAHGMCSAPGCEETHTVRPQLEAHMGGKRRSGRSAWVGVAVAVIGLGAVAALTDRIVTSMDKVQQSAVQQQTQVVAPKAPQIGPPIPKASPEWPEITDTRDVSFPAYGSQVSIGHPARTLTSVAVDELSGRDLSIAGPIALELGGNYTLHKAPAGPAFAALTGVRQIAKQARNPRDVVFAGRLVALGNDERTLQSILGRDAVIWLEVAEQPVFPVGRNSLAPRVLVLEKSPRYEYRYLKNELIAKSSFVVQAYLTAADPDFVQESSLKAPVLTAIPDLDDYDVVVLGDLDREVVDRLDVARFVTRGGGLVLLPGQGGLAALGPAVEALSPVADAPLDPNLGTVGQFAVGNVGHPSMAGLWSRGALRPLAPLSGVRPGLIRPGATSLLEGPKSRPLIATWTHGRGKVVYLASDQFWRWRSQPGPETYLRFWSDIIFWAGLRTPGNTSETLDAVEFTNVSIRNAVAQIARASRRSIVVDSDVEEAVSVSLQDVNWRVALEVVARNAHCEIEEQPSGVFVLVQAPKLTLQISDGGLRTVLSLLASYGGKVLTLDPAVSGTSSVTFKGVPWDVALKEVCERARLSLEIDGGDVRIRPAD